MFKLNMYIQYSLTGRKTQKSTNNGSDNHEHIVTFLCC